MNAPLSNRTATAGVTGRDLWKLIDRVRDRSYDIFVFAEKQRMHDIVVALKSKGTISPDDFEWLKRADENLSFFAPIPVVRRWKGGAP